MESLHQIADVISVLTHQIRNKLGIIHSSLEDLDQGYTLDKESITDTLSASTSLLDYLSTLNHIEAFLKQAHSFPKEELKMRLLTHVLFSQPPLSKESGTSVIQDVASGGKLKIHLPKEEIASQIKNIGHSESEILRPIFKLLSPASSEMKLEIIDSQSKDVLSASVSF